MSFDCIIIGAGHNGLVAALRLAGAGRKVLVLERRRMAGGLCALHEFEEGYQVPGVLEDTRGFRLHIAEALDLQRFGLSFHPSEDDLLAPAPSESDLVFRYSPETARYQLEGGSPNDTEAYQNWQLFLAEAGPFVLSLLDQSPPPLAPGSASDFWKMGKQALSLRRLGGESMLELARVVPMSAADWLGEHFDSSHLQEMLAVPAVRGSFCGPRSAGTAANLLFYECASRASIQGGPPALVDSLLKAAEQAGVQVRTEAEVTRIRFSQGRVSAVDLRSGEAIDARSVVATCDPKQTFLKLVDPAWLPLVLEDQMLAFRSRGCTARVHLALRGPLHVRGHQRLFGRLRLGGGSVNDLERAFDAVKYARFAEHPVLEVSVPTVADPSLAPGGHHVAAIGVHTAPIDLEGGWSSRQREALLCRVIAVLARYVPEIEELIVAREVWTPLDLENEFGLTGGHLFHGEHALDQFLFMRPGPETSAYETPLEGLFLAGSGSHPGGGITGLPGWLGAGAVLQKNG